MLHIVWSIVVGFVVGVGDAVAGLGVVGRGDALAVGVGDPVGTADVSGVGLGEGRVIAALAEGSGDCSGPGEI